MPLDAIPESAVILTAHRVGVPPGAFTADSLEGRPVPPRNWLVPGMAPAGQVSLLSGDGGVGKSTLAMQLCCASALGRPWIGQETRRGRSLFLSAEDDADELHRRLDAMAMHFGCPLGKLGSVMVWPVADQADPALAVGDGAEGLAPTPRWSELCATVRSWRPGLIVIDAVADAFAGSENNRAQVRKFVALCRTLAIETGAAILLLSHPSLTGMSSGSGLSGSTAWNNSVRSRLYLTRPKIDADTVADPDRRTLSVVKANYAAAGGELRLRLQAGGFVDDDRGASALDLAVQGDRAEAKFLALVGAYNAEARPVSHVAGRNFAPNWFAKDPRAEGIPGTAFARAMSRLLASGQVKVSRSGPPSRQRNELSLAEPSA